MTENHIPELKTELTALKNTTAISLDISLWTARRKLTPEDFCMDAGSLPPEELASLGTKRIAPPESLRIFSNLRSRAVALLSRNGVRFMGGWLISDMKKDKVLKELAGMRDDFTRAKAAFLANYDLNISDWIARHEEWKDLLEGSAVSPEYVKRQLHFGWHAYKFSIKGTDDAFKESVRSVASTLFDEIASDAAAMWKDVFSGRESVNHRALNPLKTLVGKLEGLVFVEPRVAPVIRLIHTALNRLPVKGNIVGPDLAGLQGIVCLLKDRDTLIGHAQSILDGTPPALVLGSLTPAQAVSEPSGVIVKTVGNPAIANSMGLW